MFNLLIAIFYQPFFNLLVGLYWVLNQLPDKNITMGIVVVLFTIFVRIILLPVSLASYRSEKERRAIAKEIAELEHKYKGNPVAIKYERKRVLDRNKMTVIASLISLAIQVAISLVLWRMFSTGLSGSDVHLLYSFMPDIFPIPPEKMTFMGLSLDHPHWQLNLFQSFLIFVLETLSTYISPYPVSRKEVVRLQLTLPIISFIIFSQLPAGKKLFVITTLLFSIGLTLFMAIRKKLYDLQEKLDKRAEEKAKGEEKVVVEVK